MSKINKKSIPGVCCWLLVLTAFWHLCTASVGFAGEPLQTLKTYSEKVMHILQATQDKDQEITEKQLDKLRDLGREIFSFEQISMRTLGRNWPELNKEQQTEFVKLFPQLLEKNYLGKIHEYEQESVEFTRETIFSARKAEVKSLIQTKSKEIPVDYRLVKLDEGWKVYDVVVEGVSLVRNYRSQFSEILTDNSPQEMLEILRKKTNKQ